MLFLGCEGVDTEEKNTLPFFHILRARLTFPPWICLENTLMDELHVSPEGPGHASIIWWTRLDVSRRSMRSLAPKWRARPYVSHPRTSIWWTAFTSTFKDKEPRHHGQGLWPASPVDGWGPTFPAEEQGLASSTEGPGPTSQSKVEPKVFRKLGSARSCV